VVGKVHQLFMVPALGACSPAGTCRESEQLVQGLPDAVRKHTQTFEGKNKPIEAARLMKARRVSGMT
jgi:hypothetical protein